MRFDLDEWATSRRARIDAFVGARFHDAWPERFAEACRYPLGTGGKRFRPLITLAAAEALGGPSNDAALAAGAAVELVHTYSLIHDDLPCMDDDDERRGNPTVHVAFGENAAVLAGDALLTEAFRVLGEAPTTDAIRVALVCELALAAGHVGMIGGQAADIGLGGPVVDAESLQRLHMGKTGALIRWSARAGGLVMDAEPDQLERLTTYGNAVGLAFQMADDVLDEEEDATDDGPPSYVKLLGVAATRRRAHELEERAIDAVSGLPRPDALVAMARYTVERSH